VGEVSRGHLHQAPGWHLLSTALAGCLPECRVSAKTQACADRPSKLA
jgi:hypothetical protein